MVDVASRDAIPREYKNLLIQMATRWPRYDGNDVKDLFKLKGEVYNACSMLQMDYLPMLKGITDEDLKDEKIVAKYGDISANKAKIIEGNDLIVTCITASLRDNARINFDQTRWEITTHEGRRTVMVADWFACVQLDQDTLFREVINAKAAIDNQRLYSRQGIKEYRNRVLEAVMKLRIAEKFSETDVVDTLLQRLPERIMLMMMPHLKAEKDKTLANFWQQLNTYASFLVDGEQQEAEAAYYASQSHRGRGSGQRYPGQGNYGRGRGRRGVRRGKQHSREQQDEFHRFDGNCHYCKGYGHKQADCKKKKNDAKKNQKNGPPGAYAHVSVVTVQEEAHASIPVGQDVAIVDTGASSHFLNNAKLFESMEIHKVPIDAGGRVVVSQAIGTARMLVTDEDGVMQQIVLRDAYYVPDFSRNLISTSQLGKTGVDVTMPSYDTIVMKQDNVVWKAKYKMHGLPLYTFDIDVVRDMSYDTIVDMHRRLGHPPAAAMRKMLKDEEVDLTQLENKLDSCEECHLHKAKLASIPKKAEPRTPRRPGDLIVSDMFGPISPPSLRGDKYIIAYKDIATGYLFLDPVKSKEELLVSFQRMLRDSSIPVKVNERDVARQTIFQSDNDGPYRSTAFRTKLKELGITWRCSPPRTPQMNGAIENTFREIRDMVGVLLEDSKLSRGFWAYAAKHAEYLINIKVKEVLNDMSAYQLLHGRNPHTLLDLHDFGADAYVCDKDHRDFKFGRKARKGIYVGYSPAKLSHKVYMPDTKKMIETVHLKLTPHSRDEGENVTLPSLDSLQQWRSADSTHASADLETTEAMVPMMFDDPEPVPGSPTATSSPDATPFASPTTHPLSSSPEADDGIGARLAARRSAGNGRNKSKYDRLNETELGHFANRCSTAELPQSVAEALTRPDASAWQRALDNEMASFQEHQVLIGLDHKPNANVLDLRVVFDIKQDGRYKARIVAKGFKQREGINYDETYSPTVNMTTIRLLMALATHQHYHVHQVDVKTAFLHAPLEEDIYVRVPRGLEAGLGGCEYAKLNKAVYGLKQASRAWYLELDKYFRNELHCRRLRQDECVYVYTAGTDTLWALAYVDDIVLVGSSERIIADFKQKLMHKFETKDFGEIKNFLNMEFTISKDSIVIKQTAYIESILKEFNMASSKPTATPWPAGLKLERIDSRDESFPFRKLTGKLNYLATHTRPDIAATVSFLSAHNQGFDETHWQAAKRLLRYLQGTKDLGIRFSSTSRLQLDTYVDASFAQEHDKKSREGCVIFLCNGPVYWRSKRQTTTAASTAEAEYMAAHSGAIKSLILHELMDELLDLSPDLKPLIYCDNQPAIANVINGNAQRGQHHMLIKFYALREMYERQQLDIVYCPTDEMIADLLTKPLPRDAHERHTSKLCFSA